MRRWEEVGLDEYRRKRREGATNEPFGDGGGDARATLTGAFVVHQHDATRMHYDLRVEAGGVLASFAVPHGPSLKPLDKHLAIRTEDHPLEYLEFEGIIPDGQYGAGAMIAWDRGVVTYLEGPAEEGLVRGKLDMMLRGHKLRGRFALVRTKGRAGEPTPKQEPWLLIKKSDAYASVDREITREAPRSVMSGLRVDELASREAIGAALEERARAHGATTSAIIPPAGAAPGLELVGVREAESAEAAPEPRVFDPHLDGVRVLATREGDVVRLLVPRADGSFEEVSAFYPEIVRAIRATCVERLALDGHLLAFDETGHPSLALLAKRVALFAKGEHHRASVSYPVALIAEDLLVVGGRDIRELPLTLRRELSCALLPPQGLVRAEPPLEGDLAPILAFCTEHGIDGLVAKPPRSRYRQGAGDAWTFIRSQAEPSARATVDHSATHAQAALRRVTVTNRAKVFWPASGYTKGDLCDYYAAIGDTLLPYLADRPVILVRYPDGIDGKSFFQWNVPVGMPAWVRTLSVEDDGEEREPRPEPASRKGRAPRAAQKPAKRGFLVEDPSTLLYIANLACIPLHVLAYRAASPDRADFLTMDFDIKQGKLEDAITLARALHELLDAIGLPGFPKTSGQSGLHVLVPLGPGAHGFDTARTLADLLGRILVERHPDIATMERVVSRRGARIYVDTGQTGASRAIAAPYSVRAVPGATVSTPLTWDEVTPDLDPAAFDLRTVPARVAATGDPMRPLLTLTPDVPAAIQKLSDIITHLR